MVFGKDHKSNDVMRDGRSGIMGGGRIGSWCNLNAWMFGGEERLFWGISYGVLMGVGLSANGRDDDGRSMCQGKEEGRKPLTMRMSVEFSIK
jgi:hypothetical protein